MKHTVKMPKLGDTADEVVAVEWLVAEGSRVSVGDPVLAVETSKANAEVVSPVEGVMVKHLVAPDQEIAIGAPVFVVDASG